MPDFFEGEPADISWYPPDNEDKGKKLGNFFSTKAVPPATLNRIPGILNAAGTFPGGWAIVGYCWGGKIASLTASGLVSTHFNAAVQCHPAMLDPKDAEKVVIPMCILASMDEDVQVVEEYKSKLQVKNHVQYFPDQIHGWMAARGDLSNDKVRKEYENGYKAVVEFLSEAM
jgi:dienelactone hydrolase